MRSSRSVRLRSLVVLAMLGASSAVSAETAAIPEESLRAVANRIVRLELTAAPAVEGKLLAFDDRTITIALTSTQEVITVSRAQLVRVLLVDEADAPVERMRVVGVQMSLLGTLAVDADYKRLRGFASTSLLLPITTASGGTTWLAGALGGGISLPFGANRRWRLDVFGQVVPLRMTSWYTYVGFGAGAGVHYTGSSGFTAGITFPVIGWATRFGSSPYGYDASFRYNDSLSYFYVAGLAGMPLFTMGYRFATNCPRID